MVYLTFSARKEHTNIQTSSLLIFRQDRSLKISLLGSDLLVDLPLGLQVSLGILVARPGFVDILIHRQDPHRSIWVLRNLGLLRRYTVYDLWLSLLDLVLLATSDRFSF